MKQRPVYPAAAVAWFALLLLPGAARAQQGETASKADLEALKKGQDAILKELQEIKKLIQQQPRPSEPQGPNARSISLDIGARPVQGNRKAPVTLVEFSDYQCSFCSTYHKDVQPKIEEDFIKTGKVRRVFFDLPLESIHPSAFMAAQASRCADEQGKYFDMQARLYDNQKIIDQWQAHAAAVGLDAKWFAECIASGRYAEAVRKDMATAAKAGIQSTPIFLLAKTDPVDPVKVTGLSLIVGAKPFEVFKKEIEKALAEVGGTR